MTDIVCAYCGKTTPKETGAVIRARKLGAPIYCNRTCAGLGRRNNKTTEQKKEEKRLYDIEYRNKNYDRLKIEKAESFKRRYDPEKARIQRKANMHKYVEYCRQPEYRAKKIGYDRVRRAKKQYGDFWEAGLLLLDLDCEIESRISKYEIRSLNGTLNKSLQRKRMDGRD